MAFCFDSITGPPNDLNKVVARAVNAVTRDQKHSESPVLPIVHLPCSHDGTTVTQLAPEVVLRVAKALEVPIVGIPERELGDGIVERVTTMTQIRSALSGLCYYQLVHVLGTGDPSLLRYYRPQGQIRLTVWNGVDTFWTRTMRGYIRYKTMISSVGKTNYPISNQLTWGSTLRMRD